MSFHQFNPLTGRLRQSSQLQSLYPLSPRPLEKSEQIMMYDTNKTKPVTTPQQGAKRFASTVDATVAKFQKAYQVDPSKPTYLLRGKSDRLLLGINTAICVTSFVINMYYMNVLRKKFSQ
ncbi:uncharacterized protein LOC108624181 [Ceratina calcarata]|uniref:Uncharacterized protein LOC108624181 n=1 Tax=Ceratina calcarata TaxID=156304 RepID=A0AAJ7IX89_9HYME|nr:uncharacterized protein LOC108624181 [Ceratina calcarata]